MSNEILVAQHMTQRNVFGIIINLRELDPKFTKQVDTWAHEYSVDALKARYNRVAIVVCGEKNMYDATKLGQKFLDVFDAHWGERDLVEGE